MVLKPVYNTCSENQHISPRSFARNGSAKQFAAFALVYDKISSDTYFVKMDGNDFRSQNSKKR